jgi:hypothetical protein
MYVLRNINIVISVLKCNEFQRECTVYDQLHMGTAPCAFDEWICALYKCSINESKGE